MRSITNANFSCQAGRGGGGREARIENLVHLQRPNRFRIVSERSTQELVPKNDCSRGGCIPFPAKRGPWSCLKRSSQVSGIVSSALAVDCCDTNIPLGIASLHHEIQRQ